MQQTRDQEMQQDDSQRAAQFAALLSKVAAREAPGDRAPNEYPTDESP